MMKSLMDSADEGELDEVLMMWQVIVQRYFKNE